MTVNVRDKRKGGTGLFSAQVCFCVWEGWTTVGLFLSLYLGAEENIRGC